MLCFSLWPCALVKSLVFDDMFCGLARPLLSSRAQSQGSALRLSLATKISTELQHRTRRRTVLSAGNGRRVTPGSEAAVIETHVPLPIRCWSSVKIPGGRKAQSRFLDCAPNEQTGKRSGRGFKCPPTQAKRGLNGPPYSFRVRSLATQKDLLPARNPEKPRVAHSSRVWLEWRTSCSARPTRIAPRSSRP